MTNCAKECERKRERERERTNMTNYYRKSYINNIGKLWAHLWHLLTGNGLLTLIKRKSYHFY